MVAGGAGAEQDKEESRKSLICSNYPLIHKIHNGIKVSLTASALLVMQCDAVFSCII